MATSPEARARALAYRRQQEKISTEAADFISRMLLAKLPWAVVLTRLAEYQLLAATIAVETMAEWAGRSEPNVDPTLFAGVSSFGFPISEPLIATIDARVPAPAQAIPAPWWDGKDADAFVRQVRQLIDAEVLDAARSAAGAEMVTEPDWQNYVRVLTPPSCKRCVVLAGRIYRDLDGFDRHPGCDCVHYPVESWEEAHDVGLVASPEEAFEKGMIRDLTKAEQRAIEDGGDVTTVINSSSGIYTADVLGERTKATTYGTTKRALWRKLNPTRRVRLRPEAIYKIVDQHHGGDRDVALRMLDENGYLTEAGRKILDTAATAPEALADRGLEDALDLAGEPGAGAAATRMATQLIDSVHTMPRELPDLPWRPDLIDADVNNGQYMFLPFPGAPTAPASAKVYGEALGFAVSDKSPTPLITALHELGHFIDHKGLGEDTARFASGVAWHEGGDLKPLMEALYNSEAGKMLRVMQGWKDGLPFAVVELENGDLQGFQVDKTRVAYYLDPREIFARAYAQWIATRSGNIEALRQLARARDAQPNVTLRIGQAKTYPRQWEDTDFAPIAKAFDDYFEALGSPNAGES